MRAIFKMNFDCGRQGNLTGTFVDFTERVNALKEKQIEVYFGEVLGKHSEVYGPLNDDEITIVSTDEKDIENFERLELESGYNPFEFTYFGMGTVELESIDDETVGELLDRIL